MQKLNTALHRYKQWVAKPAVAVVISVLACFGLPYIYGCLCEFVRAASVYYTLQYLEAHIPHVALGAVVTAGIFFTVTMLTARLWVANLVVGGLLCLASWISLQKVLYRGEPLLPNDIFQAGTAFGVAQEMTFTIPRETWVFIVVVLLATLVLLPVRLPFFTGTRKGWLARLGLALLPPLLMPFYFHFVLYNKPLLANHFNTFRTNSSMSVAYHKGSFVTSFFIYTQDLFPPEAPERYSAEAVTQAVELLDIPAAAGQRECDVIVVLLESYFELFNYDTAQIAEPLHENFYRLAQEGISGQMLSTGYGGGTANIEFSVLTGYTIKYLPTGALPYMQYIRSGFLCYPQFLHNKGYQTIALHPYNATYYRRNDAYPLMGFDLFVSEGAFSSADATGLFVDEKATFAKAVELYEQAAENGPVFLHIVTMQNHGPNIPNKYPAEHQVSAIVPGASDTHNGALTSLATGLRDIDAAIGEFTDALRKEDRDIVVLFFGDHQTVALDGGQELLTTLESYNALPGDEQTLRTHVTPYLMWANFDIEQAGTDGGLLPSYMLLPVMLNAYNVVRPGWMDWLLATEPALGELDYDLYFTDADKLLAKMTDEQQAVYLAQELLQYDLMFGKQYAAQALYAAAP